MVVKCVHVDLVELRLDESESLRSLFLGLRSDRNSFQLLQTEQLTRVALEALKLGWNLQVLEEYDWLFDDFHELFELSDLLSGLVCVQ